MFCSCGEQSQDAQVSVQDGATGESAREIKRTRFYVWMVRGGVEVMDGIDGILSIKGEKMEKQTRVL